MSKIGFIGLGIMGAPMAGHLLAGGHELSVFTRGKVPESVTTAGAKVCANSKQSGAESRHHHHHGAGHPDVEKVFDRTGSCGLVSRRSSST